MKSKQVRLVDTVSRIFGESSKDKVSIIAANFFEIPEALASWVRQTTIKGFGTEFRTTTFFRCKDGVTRVRCGCFYGDLEEFRVQVKNTRKGKIAEEYLMIADLMEKHFKE